MDEEYVETSDIEELEEWNTTLRFQRARSNSPEGSRGSLPPFKKIKLFHEGDVVLPTTPAKRAQGDHVPETAALKTVLRTPTPSHSSATARIDHVTSPTQVSGSPLASKEQPGSEGEHGPVVSPYWSQDPLLLHSPTLQRVPVAETPWRSTLNPPSPFLVSTTPPCSPTVDSKRGSHVRTPDTALPFQPPSLRVDRQSSFLVRPIDDDGDVLMDHGGPGIDSLFSSPVKGPNEESTSRLLPTSSSPLRLPSASSPVSRLGSESPSPFSPLPPRSPSELSSIPGERQDEDESGDEGNGEDGLGAPVQEEAPIIPQEGHYTFRERKLKQMKPYTADKLEYNAVTKNHREARVIIRSPSRGNNRPLNESKGNEEEESQDQAFVAEEDESEHSEGERRSKKRKRAEVDDPLDEIQNREDLEERRRRRERRKAEKAQLEEEQEVRRKEREQRKRQREEEAAVRRRTIVQRSSRTPPVAGSSSGRGESPVPINQAEDIFDRYERELEDDDDDDDDDLGDVPSVTARRTTPDDAISISDDSDGAVALPARFPLSSRTRSPASSRRGSTAPPRTSSPVPDTSQSTARPSRPDSGGGLSEVHDVKLLFRMYPPGLARQLLKTGRFGSKASGSRPAEPDLEDQGPLQPGQTRVRKRKGAERREIKGDSDSDPEVSDREDGPRSPSPPHSAPGPSSYTQERAPPRRRATHRDAQIRTEYESDAGSDVEIIRDNAIDLLTVWEKPTTVRPKEEVTLIDYMLSGTRVLKSGGKKGKKPRKPKLDIVAAGVRPHQLMRQSRLSNYDGFGQDHEMGTSRSGQHTNQTRSRRSETSVADDFDEEGSSSGEDDFSNGSDDGQPAQGGHPRRGAGHRKAKAQQHRRDIYILKPPRGGKAKIVSGAHKEMRTVDVEEDAAIGSGHPGPKIRQWDGPGAYRRVRPPTHRPPLDTQNLRPERHASSTPAPLGHAERGSSPMGEWQEQADTTEPETEAERIRIIKDSGVSRLLGGIAFASGTYTQKGWLWELISSIKPSPDWVPVAPIALCESEYDIPLDATMDAVASAVNKTLDDLFNFAYKPLTSTPETEREREASIDNWTMISQNVCRGVSFCMGRLSGDDRSTLVQRVKDSIEVLVDRLESWKMPRCQLDARVLLATWIAVDLSARIGEPLTYGIGSASSVLVQSIQLLVNLLLFYGLDSTMKPVVRSLEADPLSKTSLPVYTAELWVRLIHLCGEYDKGDVKQRSSTFWRFVTASFKSSLQGITPDAGYHEDLWHSVFALCALSQFNAHGMVRDAVNLPECWELAHFLCDEAFKHTPEMDPSYVRYLLGRFFILNERWGWKVVNVAPLVKLVVDKVFHPSKFRNLEGEKPEFPEFLREPDDSDLSTWASTDSAYVLLLKFVSKAAREPGVKESAIKKLISLSEPAASLNFDKERPLKRRDMDRIINRVTAAILAVQLVNNEAYFASKVQQIRTTMHFSVANPQTRLTLIRGIDYWIQFIVRRQPSLGVPLLTPWLGDMVSGLTDLWKSSKGKVQDHRQLLTKMVLRVVQKAYETAPHEPVGDFLEELRPLLRVTRDDEAIQQDARMILVIATDRWYREYPPSRPPAPQEETQEESQDLYGDAFGDIDWGGADIPEELGGPASSQVHRPRPAGRVSLKAAIAKELHWFLFRSLKYCFENGDADNGRTFMSAWVGCKLLLTNVTVEEEIEAMSATLEKVGEDKPSLVKRTVDTAFSSALLRRHPMAYTIPQLVGHFKLDYFLTCLAEGDPSSLAFAAEYVGSFLSADYLQHPVLNGCGPLLSSSGRPPLYAYGVEEFLKIRVGALETIVSNINGLLERDHPEANLFVDALAESFSSMRQVLRTNTLSRDDKKTFRKFCQGIQDAAKNCPTLEGHPRMAFWVNTWKPLGNQSASVVDH